MLASCPQLPLMQLAEMSVHQTREFFKKRYGYIVDNPNVGPTLTSAYWECGNSRPFLEIVKELTGKELSGEPWTNELKEGVEERINREKKEYDKALAQSSDECQSQEIDLDMVVRCVGSCAVPFFHCNATSFFFPHLFGPKLLVSAKLTRFVDGDSLISDSSQAKGGLLGACQEFESYVEERVNAAGAASKKQKTS